MDETFYQEKVQKIFDLQFFGIKLGLVNIKGLLEELGRPQDSFKTILVAGTNGKGSIASTLASICTESGLSCGLFTSPHLVRFNERFAVNQKLISDEKVIEISDRIWKIVDRRQITEDPDGPSPITFFEFATAMACVYFKEAGCNIAIFECGLGGRLDATNALDPMLDVFTPISYDHTQYLGDTLTSIANEKSGILRNRVPAVISKQPDEAKIALFAKFQELSVPSTVFDRDYGVRWNDDGAATYWDQWGELTPVTTALPGAYQLGNTSVAIAAARVLQKTGVAITDDAILAGPKKVFWPGRLEKVAENPTIILDGAHNIEAARLLAKTISEKPFAGKTIGVMSIMSDKNVERIVQTFAPAFDTVVATRANVPRATKPEDLARIVAKYVSKVESADRLSVALEKAKQLAGTDGRVVICGSLFLIGEARALILGDKGEGPSGAWIGVRG